MRIDPIIELLEEAFGAGYDHATTNIWGWDQDFRNFLNDFSDEIDAFREKNA